ncbi:PLP-dependent aminotransferase family protein [Pseudooceanicola sp.]|uniref:MocR-like ectoine utilization transcription factor EhuR n=1 Tax=Pseudooceanicola sp. TaxID=1914328 RepID=UPI0035C6F095
MSHWPLNPEDITRPAYRSLAQGIAAAIGAGTLRAGDRLPAHRDMAWKMGVSVQTVSRAYEELIRADLVSGEVGRGTYVKPWARETVAMPWYNATRERPPIDLSLMTPVSLPQITEAWKDTLHRLGDRLPDAAVDMLRPDQVSNRFSGLASTWLASCGLVAGTRRVLVTNGMTPAMFVALAAIANPGDVIAADPFTSHTLPPVAHHLQLALQPIEGDDHGMLPEALREAARASPGQIKAVFLLPSGGGPLARVMPRERREALAATAEELGLAILEGDPLGPLTARRLPPVSSLAPRRAFYFTGMTKCLSPGLRLGFLVMPEAMVERTLNRHLSISWTATPLMAEIAHDWVQSGTAQRLLDLQRNELALRNRIAQRLLGPRCLGGPHGLHRWIPLPDDLPEETFLRRALDRGVAVAAGSGFRVAEGPGAIRLCLGGAGRAELERGLGTIADLLPDPAQGLAGNA